MHKGWELRGKHLEQIWIEIFTLIIYSNKNHIKNPVEKIKKEYREIINISTYMPCLKTL